MRPAILVNGMHGLGDNIHQRAVMEQLRQTHDVYLRTSWPQIYHDMDNVFPVRKITSLRTQAKNAATPKGFYRGRLPNFEQELTIKYDGKEGSVLTSMLKHLGLDPTIARYNLPIPIQWDAQLPASIPTDKPILVYRPLVVRKEWDASARNPDPDMYYILFKYLRDHYFADHFVVSVADLVPDVEWMTSHPVEVDLELHKGELSFEALAALFNKADLVFTAPGFPIPLARAVNTPVVAVFGGYEDSRSFEIGTGPFLGIDTIARCRCFKLHHQCKKQIDLRNAEYLIDKFVSELKAPPVKPIEVRGGIKPITADKLRLE